MNDLTTYFGYLLFGVSLLGLFRVWWSTRSIEVRRLKSESARSEKLLHQLNNELETMRENRELLTTAVRLHKETIKQKDEMIAEKVKTLQATQRSLSAARKANDVLSEILGNQEQLIEKLTNDVRMLHDQVFELRAKLGLEPEPNESEK